MKQLHQPGEIIADRYRLVLCLGQGGMGTTYEAEDLTNYQRVALKVASLRQVKDWKVLELFEREARVLASLEHPNIPKYLDYFHLDTPDDRRFYLIQELVSGDSLAELVKKGWHTTEVEIKEIASKILEILNYLHHLQPPVIHRDIKPQNIIRRRDGEIFLVDFGAVQDIYKNTISHGATFVGTLGYMSLEQMRGRAYFASDLYSLGATLLFVLTHRDPVDLPQVRMKIDFRDRVKVSPAFADWLAKMIEPTVEDRFKSAQEAFKALEKSQNSANLQSSETEWKALPRWRQPKGSRVILQKTPSSFVMIIPPVGWDSLAFFFLIAGILVNQPVWLFVGSGIIHVIGTGQLILSLFSLILTPFFLIGLIFFVLFLWRISGNTRLEINGNQVKIQWFLIPWLNLRHEVQGRTTDIQNIYLDAIYDHSQEKKLTQVTLLLRSKKIYFAGALTPAEKAWVVSELGDFMDRLRS